MPKHTIRNTSITTLDQFLFLLISSSHFFHLAQVIQQSITELTLNSNPTFLASSFTSSKLNSTDPSPLTETCWEFSKCHRSGPRFIQIPPSSSRSWMIRRYRRTFLAYHQRPLHIVTWGSRRKKGGGHTQSMKKQVTTPAHFPFSSSPE